MESQSEPASIYIVLASAGDHIGNGIWGVFTSWRRAKDALAAEGLEVHEHYLNEEQCSITPEQRMISVFEPDYRLRRRRRAPR